MRTLIQLITDHPIATAAAITGCFIYVLRYIFELLFGGRYEE
jgi:hypothetical protein